MKNLTKSGNIKLYFHETSGGAKYLFDTFVTYKHRITGKKCKEGAITDSTKYVVRIDGDITKDAELTVKTSDTENEITINNIALASELAHNAACDEMIGEGKINDEEAMWVEDGDGFKNYSDVAAEIYDRHYDYFRNIIDSHKITG